MLIDDSLLAECPTAGLSTKAVDKLVDELRMKICTRLSVTVS